MPHAKSTQTLRSLAPRYAAFAGLSPQKLEKRPYSCEVETASRLH
jgi:hypothetical protein